MPAERKRPRVLSVVGTRPEAIKMAPVIAAIEREPQLESVVCATGQHNELLHSALASFGVRANHDLQVMRADQTLAEVTARVIEGVSQIIREQAPDVILVHGDTTTTMSASLAAFYQRVPVGHVEAGLRSGDLENPFPEEANRIVTDRLAAHCYAPTEANKRNLIAEGIAPERIHVTGNTAIDALLWMRDELAKWPVEQLQAKSPALHAKLGRDPGRMVLVTAHRRENFGDGLRGICEAVAILAARHPSFHFVYPVHPNPNVRRAVDASLRGIENVQLIEPVDYETMVWLMGRAFLILTDSGGVQEEAPSLGKPVIVLREKTERHEAVDAGTVVLAGVDRERIVALAEELILDPVRYAAMVGSTNPYGDGLAAGRIVKHLVGALCAGA